MMLIIIQNKECGNMSKTRNLVTSVKLILNIFLLTFMFLCISATVTPAGESTGEMLTSEERAWLDSNSGKLTLLFNTDFPPIEFSTETGSFTGMGADIIAMVERRLGVTFSKVPSNDWNRHLAALESGEYAIEPTIVRTAEKERYAFFTNPYAVSPVVIITTQAFNGPLTIDHMNGLRVAVVSGDTTEKFLTDRAQGRFEVFPVANVREGLRILSFGQVDAFVENLAVASYYIEKEGIQNLRLAGSTDYSFEWCIGVSRKYPLLYSSIQKALEMIPKNELEAVHRQWISLDTTGWMTPETRRILKFVNYFFSTVLFILAAFGFILQRRLRGKIAILKKAQQEALEQTELVRLVSEAASAGVWDFYPQEGIGYLSTQWYLMFGYTPKKEAIPLDEWKKYLHPEDEPRSSRAFSEYIEKLRKGPFELEFRVLKADGSWCWILAKGKAVAWDGKGVPTRMIGINLDITRIKKAQEEVARSEAKFRALFDNAPYPAFISSIENRRFLDVNRAFMESLGLTKEQILNMSDQDLNITHDIDPDTVLKELLKTGSVHNIETVLRRSDGTYGYILFSAVLLQISGQKQVLSMTVDLTERKRAEKALKESEERFRSIFDMSPLPLTLVSMEGEIIEANRRMTQIMGYTIDDMPNIEQWWDVAFPDTGYRDRARADWMETVKNALYTESIKEMGEYSITCKNGKKRDMITFVNVIGNRLLISFFDVTDRKKAEEERGKLQDQLLQSQKLEAIGTLAGGIAHDFNNMLGAIIGYSELTMKAMDQKDPLRKNLARILDAAYRSSGLTRQLLAFARKQTITPVVLDLNRSIEDILKMLRICYG